MTNGVMKFGLYLTSLLHIWWF